MKHFCWHASALFLSLITVAIGKPQEFTILGSEKIKAEVQQGMPLPAEKSGIKVEVAAFMVGEGKLIFTFGFLTKKNPTKVVVEDVSDTKPLVLVEDASPKIEERYWRGDAVPLPLTKTGVPWVFERGDTTRIFRFTVTLKGEAQPVVLYQPAIYPRDAKAQLAKMAK